MTTAADLIETMAMAICQSYAGDHEPPLLFWDGNEDNHRATARAALAAIEAAGYRVVPVETVDEARAALYGAREVLGKIANIQHAIDLLNAAAPKHEARDE